jgi:nicotinamide-nucleotide amidase
LSELSLLAAKIISLLQINNQTLTVAESCTGGLLGAALTDISGSSAVFWGGIIAYDNSAKTNLLHVSQQTLENYGAVSSECALEMAASVRSLLNTSYGIAITGIAGPAGGTESKPVGTVYIAVAAENKRQVEVYHFSGDRTAVRHASVEAALRQVHLMIET